VAIIVMAVIFWATDVLNAGITAVLTLGLLLAEYGEKRWLPRTVLRDLCRSTSE
jgi:hypothetical protein